MDAPLQSLSSTQQINCNCSLLQNCALNTKHSHLAAVVVGNWKGRISGGVQRASTYCCNADDAIMQHQ